MRLSEKDAVAEPPTVVQYLAADGWNRRRFGAWAATYAAVILYASTVIGPEGFNFVPLAFEDAWQEFLAMPYLIHGSDQRADWMSNLLMLVPLGFLVAGTVWPRRHRTVRWMSAAAGFFICVLFVLAIKFCQVFFPPRTVSVNYVVAQTLGSFVGVLLFWQLHGVLLRAARSILASDRSALTVTLLIYTSGLLFFYLFPFDFILSSHDLRLRIADLPNLMLSFPEEGRPAIQRIALASSSMLAALPLGVLLTVWKRWSLLSICLLGLAISVGVTFTTMFILSAAPSLVSTVDRVIGISMGAVLARAIERKGIDRLRAPTIRSALVIVPIYVVGILLINDLITTHWRTMEEAGAALDYPGLLPFWHFYIVGKAHAFESLLVHAATFAPIGAMVWLWRGNRPQASWLAAALALGFSLFIEVGRWLRPGLQPDFSDPIVAAAVAALAVRAMPRLLAMLEALSAGRASDGVLPIRPVAIRTRAASRDDPNERREEAPSRGDAMWRMAVAAALIALAGAVALRYPLHPWILMSCLALYGSALWRWPAIWLTIVPITLPAIDLTPWTGWMYVGESDLIVLVTVGVLLARAAPLRNDIRLSGVGGAVIGLFIVAQFIGTARGLLTPFSVPGGTDNPYLRPDNALRLVKGFIDALVLLPFLRRCLRTQPDTLKRFGRGMVGGLALVATAVIVERAVFPGLFDFASDYRVVGTFSSMHIGGGHIGGYLAMTLPFLAVCFPRPRPAILLLVSIVGTLAGYALIVTFARAAYGATLLAAVVFGLGWTIGVHRYSRAGQSSWPIPALLAFLVAIGIAVVAGGVDLMRGRIERTMADLDIREYNWLGWLNLDDRTTIATVLGMGLGTYPRVLLVHHADVDGPTNFVMGRDQDGTWLSLTALSPLYLGQKVWVEPDREYMFSVALRSPDGRGDLSVLLCEKLLLYSINCRGTRFQVRNPGAWERFTATISTKGLEAPALGVLRRPVELSLYDPTARSTVELRKIQLLDAQHREVVENGEFGNGMSRWFFTDDDHLVWRIENQFIMSLFEEGPLGLAALLILICVAFVGAWRASVLADPMGPIVAASIAAFSACCLFNALLEAPRLATLFYLVCFIGIMMLREARWPNAGEASGGRADRQILG